MQLKLQICVGWKGRLLSGTSELVQLLFTAGDDLVNKAPVLQEEVSDTSELPGFMSI